MKQTTEKEGRRHNSTYTQVGVKYFYDSLVQGSSLVLLMKFSAKNPHLRVAANRYAQCNETKLK
jgi:hypothetical protein